MLHNLVFQSRRIETGVLSLDRVTTRLGMRLLSAMKNWPVWSLFAVAFSSASHSRSLTFEQSWFSQMLSH